MPADVLLVEKSIGLSGSTISLCTLLNHLDRSRWEPHVVLSRPEQEVYVRAAVRQPTDIVVIAPGPGLRVGNGMRSALVRRALVLVNLLAVTLPYALRLRRFGRQRGVKLVHQNNGFDVGALFAARWLGVPLVAYQRGPEWDSPTVRRLAPRVDHYLANSEATQVNLVSLGVPAEKITVAYPPIELANFANPASPAPPGNTGDGPSFGIVGQLQAWKGQRVFLRAAQRVLEALPQARAWVVGGSPVGHEDYAEELHDLASRLGIADKVIFTGFVSDVASVLHRLDVVVHASVEPEPFGRVIAEAMVAGKPVVASDAGGPREVIEHGRTGMLVEPGNHEALAGAVVALLQDRAAADRLAQAGREVAVRRFSAEGSAEVVQNTYDTLTRRAFGTVRDGLTDRKPLRMEVP